VRQLGPHVHVVYKNFIKNVNKIFIRGKFVLIKNAFYLFAFVFLLCRGMAAKFGWGKADCGSAASSHS